MHVRTISSEEVKSLKWDLPFRVSNNECTSQLDNIHTLINVQEVTHKATLSK